MDPFKKKDTEWPGTGCSKIVALTLAGVLALCSLGAWLVG